MQLIHDANPTIHSVERLHGWLHCLINHTITLHIVEKFQCLANLLMWLHDIEVLHNKIINFVIALSLVAVKDLLSLHDTSLPRNTKKKGKTVKYKLMFGEQTASNK